MRILGTIAALIAAASVVWLLSTGLIGLELIGRVVVVFLGWCLLSLPLAILCGRFIAAGGGPARGKMEEPVTIAIEQLARRAA